MARNIYVCVYDLHYPHVHKPTWNALLDYVKKNQDKIAGFIFGGDQHDNAEISHHTSGKPLLRPPGSYKANTIGFEKNILTPIENLLPKQAEKIWIDGNHEDWSQQFIERLPELQGTLERPLLYDLEARGWEVIKLGEGKNLGKLLVIHGEGLTGIGNQASIYHAKKAVESYCTSVLYGHLHTAQSYTKVLPHSTKDKWMAWSSPAACTLNPTYLRNKPTAWVNGFDLVELHNPDKDRSNFNVYPILVSEGKFSFNGVIYGEKA